MCGLNCFCCTMCKSLQGLCANLQFVKSPRKMFNCCRCVTVQLSQICTMCKIPIKIYNCCRCVDWSPSAALCANLQFVKSPRKMFNCCRCVWGWIPLLLSYYGKVCKACHWQRNIAFWAVPPPPRAIFAPGAPPPPPAFAHTGLEFYNILWGL